VERQAQYSVGETRTLMIFTQHFERLLTMFSKFDTDPQSDELTAADLYDAQAEWEAEQYEGEPVMELPDDLFMVFDDPDYWD
tara:strand:+ start:248 stop:493 length:246 start_codon:yes stop_codon:yes gene_type:complete